MRLCRELSVPRSTKKVAQMAIEVIKWWIEKNGRVERKTGEKWVYLEDVSRVKVKEICSKAGIGPVKFGKSEPKYPMMFLAVNMESGKEKPSIYAVKIRLGAEFPSTRLEYKVVNVYWDVDSGDVMVYFQHWYQLPGGKHVCYKLKDGKLEFRGVIVR